MKQGDIEIKCEGGTLLPLSSLVALQGGLKELDKENYGKLRTELSTRGFCFPIFVWQNGGKNFIVDGHQRVNVLKHMMTEGFGIPEKLPCILIKAKDADAAKRLILSASSRYGKITEEGLYEFLEGFAAQQSWDEIASTVDIPDIDLEKFEEGFIGDPGDLPDEQELPENIKVVLTVNHEDYSSFYTKLVEFVKGYPRVGIEVEAE
jgi:hypothetical protein